MSPGFEQPNMIGAYASLLDLTGSKTPPACSYLHSQWNDVNEWQIEARKQFLAHISPPSYGKRPKIETIRVYKHDGLHIEELKWQLPFGPATEAVFMKPAKTKGELPGVLGLHDHGGIKYFGKQKITRTDKDTHPLMRAHQELCYGGIAWANELAKLGYGVLVHDLFPFESRKIEASQLPKLVVERMMAHPEEVRELTPEDLEAETISTAYDVSPAGPVGQIERYNAFAAQHEDIIAKSLFSAGLTWPGLLLSEDRFALDYLSSREDIDSSRIGCCGLSGGGLRTNYLAGLDDRIRCSVTVGFMTTWKDFALSKCFTHTWMIYIPLLPAIMTFPDILAMRAPLPSLVMATAQDPLYSLEEVNKAAAHLAAVYEKAGSKEAFSFSLHDGPHKFDLPMQLEAFRWLDRWLKDS